MASFKGIAFFLRQIFTDIAIEGKKSEAEEDRQRRGEKFF